MTQTSNADTVSAAEEENDVVVVAAAAATAEVAPRRADVVVTGGMTVSSKLESAVLASLSVATLSSCCGLHAGLASGELEDRDGGEGGDHV